MAGSQNVRSFILKAGVVLAILAAEPQGRADDLSSLTPQPTAVQAKRFAVRVRLANDSPEAADFMLWYTRDRGQTWQPGPTSVKDRDYIVFEAKGEGLYGFFITAKSHTGSTTAKPAPGTPPQRWVFVDYTPPLAQWKNAELAADRNGVRRIVMDWTAYDANFDARPIALACEAAGQGQWRTIDAALPNTGRFDWTLPADVRGRVTFRLTVRDQGGHTVERLFGPISVDATPVAASTAASATPEATSRPSRRQTALASPAPKDPMDPLQMPDPATRARAQKLYDQGAWHLERGQYADAQERLLEAIQLDPTLTPAHVNLAGVLYTRGRYDEAVAQYKTALQQDPSRTTAMKGLALAYAARHEYADARKMLERLLLADGRNAEAWLDLGDVAYRMGDHEGARGYWTKAAGASPDAREVVLKAQNRLSLFSTPAGSANGKGK